ncbi:Hypothetical protein R9X50_00330300 [Acrodontium crateriforme]|uniref:E3 ubiquitin-protein ligase listerin n=1 Tax=Acrodontium crateriforme TaxID=150365 RepID=A0AAQ3M351_9PEZI|nr:Hypothetical protein R9X50_00330300 [Acrodontium crateriforme]
MSKKLFKTSANSARAGVGFGGFGNSGAGFGSSGSTLSYVQVPPDYTAISDAKIVVAFKNLAKKDGITKAKALDDLQAYLSPAEAEIEDGVLEAWVKLYPRLSIDNGLRVRQLAHTLNGSICSKCGKRIAKYLPRIAGPWLAGTYDSDRSVSRSAQEALGAVFPSAEKVHGLRRAFCGNLLEFCRDAVLAENIQTLSDERSVSPDDASATYARVVATSLALICSLVQDLPEDLQKQQALYSEIFGDSKLWDFAIYSDPSVRKSMHRLVQTTIEKQPTLIEPHIKMVSTAYIYRGMSSEQTGSATEFIRTVKFITTAMPLIWTDQYSGRESAASRLRQCLKHGSQASNGFWEQLSQLLRKIPCEIVQTTFDEVSDLAVAAREGVTRKEERNNAFQAWSAYFNLLDVGSANLSDEDFAKLLESCLIPVIKQYLQPAPDTTEWSVGGLQSSLIVSQVVTIQRAHETLAKEWPMLISQIIEAAKLSQPEQSKDFQKSQMEVAAIGQRWAELQRNVFAKTSSQDLIDSFTLSNVKLLTGCIELLESREGKPFGAAAIIADIVRSCQAHLLKCEDFKQSLEAYVKDDVHRWMFTPSREYALVALHTIDDEAVFLAAFNAAIKAILESIENNVKRLDAVRDLLPQNASMKAIEAAKSNEDFQTFIRHSMNFSKGESDISCFNDLARLGALSTKTTDAILSDLTASLSVEAQSDNALERLSKTDESTVRAFMERSNNTSNQLLPAVLRMENSLNEAVADKASALSARLLSAIGESGTNDKYSLIVSNLEKLEGRPMPLDEVLDLANRILGSDENVTNPLEMLPRLDIWEASLLNAMRPPMPSMSVSSPLGGVLHLVDPQSDAGKTKAKVDSEGLSQALRIAIYVSRLLTTTDLLNALQMHDDLRTSLLALLYLTNLLAEDSLSVVGFSDLWDLSSNVDAQLITMEFITEVNATFAKYWQSLPPEVPLMLDGSSEYCRFFCALDKIRRRSASNSPPQYYSALAFSTANANLFEIHGHNAQQIKASDQVLREYRSAKDVLLTSACIVGLQQPLASTTSLNRFCNELIADLTDINTAEKSQQLIENLLLLNVILQTQSDIVREVPKQRLIFFIKAMILLVESGAPVIIVAEVWKALNFVIPSVKDMYGEHWEQILSTILAFWNAIEEHLEHTPYDEGRVLLLNSSLRLFDSLRNLTRSEDPNDDVVESMAGKKNEITSSLIRLLKAEGSAVDVGHQPLFVTHQRLVREIEKIFSSVDDAEELYPLLYSPSPPVRQGGFDLLHRHIPAAQEQISFDAALDDKTAHLPDELISMILEAPKLDSLVFTSFERDMPTSLQGYLYSWRLVFDHFNGSSYRVKSDYIDQLKKGDYLTRLLTLSFDFLGHTRGRPVDASKFDIENYVADLEQTVEKDVQWLLVHLYFLALTHMPSLVKTFYLDIPLRQTSLAVETWTAKHFSPVIVSSALTAVAVWADKTVKDDVEYEKMKVNVGMRSREVNISYVVDEQVMAIKVILPEAYPLASAQCIGVNRVAVREEKWQSWLRNCQGVITFYNGSIIDGISAWQKNINGSLKNLAECAICYSIVDSYKHLPTKRCLQCRNAFHAGCLFKWFKTSGASTCPLCRNSFSFN